MYHRFPHSQDQLRAQCEHLRHHYHPVSLSEIAAAFREKRELPHNALAITVDDGYHDFAEAFPVFRSYGLKVTLYAVSEFADGNMWLWPDQVQQLLEATPLREAEPVLGLPLDFRDAASRQRSIDRLNQTLIAVKNADRLKILRALPGRLHTELPPTIPLRFAPLSWDQLRSLSRDGLDVGAHTCQHPILSSIESETELAEEIAGSKRRIEEQIGAPVHHFCYPNGKRADYNAAAVRWVQRAGYETGVMAEPGLIDSGADLAQLPRVGVDPSNSQLYFERRVAGYRL